MNGVPPVNTHAHEDGLFIEMSWKSIALPSVITVKLAAKSVTGAKVAGYTVMYPALISESPPPELDAVSVTP